MASPVVSVVPTRLTSVPPVATKTATRPVSTAPAILPSILMHVTPATVPHVSLPVSPDASFTAIAGSTPVLPTVFILLLLALRPYRFLGSYYGSSVFSGTRHYQPSIFALVLVGFNTSFGWPVGALPRKYLACRDVEFAELGEVFIACEDRVLALESSFPIAASTEAMLRSRVRTLQTDLSSAGASLTAGRSPHDSATLALNEMHSDSERLESQAFELSGTGGGMRLQLAAT